MKMVKVGVKAAASLVVGIFVIEGSVLYRMAIFAICYALLTYYMWYMNRRGGGFTVFIGNGGLVASLLSFGFMIISPLIPLVILSLAFNSLGLPEAVTDILSILLVIAAAGFVVVDIGRVINPSFLKMGRGSSVVNE